MESTKQLWTFSARNYLYFPERESHAFALVEVISTYFNYLILSWVSELLDGVKSQENAIM